MYVLTSSTKSFAAEKEELGMHVRILASYLSLRRSPAATQSAVNDVRRPPLSVDHTGCKANSNCSCYVRRPPLSVDLAAKPIATAVVSVFSVCTIISQQRNQYYHQVFSMISTLELSSRQHFYMSLFHVCHYKSWQFHTSH
jgi:hypothetical protein